MGFNKELDDLTIAIQDVSQGINALEAMTLGLIQARDPYADGFNALYTYLFQADMKVHTHLKTCLDKI